MQAERHASSRLAKARTACRNALKLAAAGDMEAAEALWLEGMRLQPTADDVRTWVMTRHETIRVSGDTICATCQAAVRDHPELMVGFHLLCDGNIGNVAAATRHAALLTCGARCGRTCA